MRKCPVRGCDRYYSKGKYRRCAVHRFPEPWELMERAQKNAARRQTSKTVVVFAGIVVAMWFLGDRAQVGGEETIDALERGSHAIGWAPASEADWLAREIFGRVNDERRERGLLALEWHEGLAELAREWSEEMIATGYRHSTESFRVHPDFAGIGENILMGHIDSREAHVGWMESEGHRQNILTAEYSAIGIGVVCRNDGRIWATQMFGLPRGVSPAGSRAVPPLEPIVRRDHGASC